MEFSTRREFLRTIGQAGAFCLAPSILRGAAPDDTVTISILHTTDLHGHILPTSDYAGNRDVGGLARCVTQIRRWRRQNRNSLLIDVGDVYQGTEIGLRSKGEVMIDLFNHLQYDAWVVGNHEFDWGIEPFQQALARSTMPVLAANTQLEGKPADEFADSNHPFSRVQPYILKEIAGIKIAIIGITTPGMQFWLHPEFFRGINFEHPVASVRRAIVRATGEGANAIVLCGHMGLKARTGGDDFANNVSALTVEFPGTSVFIAGHTHQAIPNRVVNGVLFTQADHFGIHAGRVDLTFDRHSKKLLGRQAGCELMDRRIRRDHVVLSRARSFLDESETALSEPIGELGDTLRVRGRPGQPSDLEKLIGTAIIESLYQRGVAVDAAFHGVFDEEHNFLAGPKTVQDIWNILPYENYVVTAELTRDEIIGVMEEVFQSRDSRSLMGFAIETEGTGVDRRISRIASEDGAPLERGRKYVIACNSYDSRSGGHRFMKLKNLFESPGTNSVFHSLQTRDALIDYFRRHKVVRKIAGTRCWPAAA